MSELKSTNLSAVLNAARLNASLNSTIRLNDYIITLEEIEGGHRLTARKGDQVQSMDIMDGTDGISPLITVTDIEGGHRVTITDAEGVKEFDVMDGQGGGGLPEGGAAYQMLVTDADGQTKWEDRAYYHKRREKVFFSRSTITDYNSDLGVYVTELHFIDLANLDSGKVVVLFDGELYDGLVIQNTPFGQAAGNLSMLNTALGTNYADTGEPFILADITNSGCYATSNFFEGEQHHYVITFPGNYEYPLVIGNYNELPYAGKGLNADAFNVNNSASGSNSHAEGSDCTASGSNSHAEGSDCTASGSNSHAEGSGCTASGDASHAEGSGCTARGLFSHAEGVGSSANTRSQHVQGEYNVYDSAYSADPSTSFGKYAHIVGNGTSHSNRSNAHTLDWNGVAWFQGRPQFGGTAQDDGAQTVMANGDTEIILKSPGGTSFKITVSDSGELTATAI